jgi:hypothetical protein
VINCNWNSSILASVDDDIAHRDRSIPGLAEMLDPVVKSPSCIPVADPFGASEDGRMRFLLQALDHREVQRRFQDIAPHFAGGGQLQVQGIRVTRYKPGRRCLIEYDVQLPQSDSPCEVITLIGKARAKGADRKTHRLLAALWRAGLRANGQDDVYVPEPIGVIPEFHMWLQRKVSGVTATRLLAESAGTLLAQRIAEAIHKVHETSVPTHRRHTMADELRILHDRLPLVAKANPHWAGRIGRILVACDRLGDATPEPRYCGIHRDFYADQVIVDGPRLRLVDFDLYCEGDPGLDIGNFRGHLIEQSLRTLGSAEALADRDNALVERFVNLSGEGSRASLSAYTTLTLVRHIYLSTLAPERRPFTKALLELSERRLGTT